MSGRVARIGVVASAAVIASACAALAGIEDLRFTDAADGSSADGTSGDGGTGSETSISEGGASALDPSFGNGGFVTGAPGRVARVASTSDGRIFAVGTAQGQLVIAGYEPSGAPSSTFRPDGGFVTVDTSGAEIALLARSMEVLVVLQPSSGTLGCNIRGYALDGGALSTTYDPLDAGGVPPKCTGAALPLDFPAAVIVGPANPGISYGAFPTFGAGGGPNTYQGGGSATTAMGTGALTILPSFRAYVGYVLQGTTCVAAFGSTTPPAIALDTSYGSGGSRCVAESPTHEIVGIVPVGDGGIVGAGNAASGAALVTEEDASALAVAPLSFAAKVDAIAVTTAGKLFVAGKAKTNGGFVARVFPDGGLDPGFGGGGVVVLGTSATDELFALTIANGDVIAGGTLNGNWTLVAFRP